MRYDAAIETAYRLISSSGEESILVRSVGGPPADPSKPWKPGPADETVYLVSTVWTTESILRRESLVKEGEVVAILAAKDFPVVPDPATDHLVRADGRRYAIVAVEPLDPNGQKILFEVRARA